jgi:hypothetical protein
MGFGNLLVTFTDNDFFALTNYISTLLTEADVDTASSSKTIVVKTPSEGVSFLLSKNELGLLHNIVEGVKKKREREYLLKSFSEN